MWVLHVLPIVGLSFQPMEVSGGRGGWCGCCTCWDSASSRWRLVGEGGGGGVPTVALSFKPSGGEGTDKFD